MTVRNACCETTMYKNSSTVDNCISPDQRRPQLTVSNNPGAPDRSLAASQLSPGEQSFRNHILKKTSQSKGLKLKKSLN